MDNQNILATIKDHISKHKVTLFMKGEPQLPECGFSAKACQILRKCGVEDFHSVNVLADPELRSAIKEFSSWPTVPQLYVNGNFVGGSDIMSEMYQTGELQKILKG